MRLFVHLMPSSLLTPNRALMNEERKTPVATSEPELAIGSYWIKGDFAVRISGKADGGLRGTVYSIDYVQPPTGPAIQGGGSSFYWERDRFTQITDPFMLSSAKGHAALCDINRLKHELAQAEKDYSMWCRIVGVMLEARSAIPSSPPKPEEKGT